MKFDRFEQAFEQAEELLPDGTNECEIVKVKDVTIKDGTQRCIVTFQAVEGTYLPAEKWFNPRDQRDHKAAMQLADAIGLPRDAEFDTSIVGRRVRITTKRGVNKSTGAPVVYCNAFAASSAPAFEQYREPEPVKAPAKRTPTQKADAASGTTNNDDIPF
jgi:hypothetical protein